MKNLLRSQTICHYHNGSWEKLIVQQRRKKRLRVWVDGRARQHPPILQSPDQGLDGGSLLDASKQIACRLDFGDLRQGNSNLQAEPEGVKRYGSTHGSAMFSTLKAKVCRAAGVARWIRSCVSAGAGALNSIWRNSPMDQLLPLFSACPAAS